MNELLGPAMATTPALTVGAASLGARLVHRHRARRRLGSWARGLDRAGTGGPGAGAGRRRPSRNGPVGKRREARPALGRHRRAWRSWAVPAGAGLGVAALVGGPGGVLVGLVLALVLRQALPKQRSPATRRSELEAERLVRQLPLTAELLAACLGSAAAPAQAAAAVAQSLPAPMGPRLAAIAAELSLGAPPENCWERLGAECPPLAPLARCLVRTTLSGAPPTASLTGLALAQRAAAIRAAHARVRRAGVLATAPLGLCFLPAFVLIGVVPVVMGLASLFAQRL